MNPFSTPVNTNFIFGNYDTTPFYGNRDTTPSFLECVDNSGNSNKDKITRLMQNYNGKDAHAIIQEFLNNDNPTKGMIVNAYFIRDKTMNADFLKIKQDTMNKLLSLNYSLKQRVISDIKNKINEIVETCDLTKDRLSVFHTVDILSIRQKIIKNEKRFIELNSINDHYDFYDALTKEELEYAGW